MKNLIRNIYSSDLSELNDAYSVPPEIRRTLAKYECLEQKLCENLTDENAEIFAQYLSLSPEIENEASFHAFYCGMRFAAKLFTELLSNN